MPRKSASEKKEAKEIRAEQDQLVTNTYADIAAVKTHLRDLEPAVQATETRLNQVFDTMPLSSAKKATAKGKHLPYQAIKRLRATINATQLKVDQFEKELTTEWKTEKNKSLEKRDMYLEGMVVELNETTKQFKVDAKKHLKDAGIRIAGWEGDEKTGEGSQAKAHADAQNEVKDEEEEMGKEATEDQAEGKEGVETDKDTEAKVNA